MANWKSFGTSLAVVILLGAIIAIVVIAISSLVSRNSPCKNNSTCPAYQICDTAQSRCVSLPGAKCKVNDDCSRYAPTCQKQGLYCTNFSADTRGSSGNPPREGSGNNLCDAGLTLNRAVNLCQQSSVGSQCTINAQCNQGLCNSTTKTCQYATTQCTGDSSLNPQECTFPYECDSVSLVCTVPGTTPGSDGSPCNSDADCAKGSSCISGPPGAGFSGVCRTGHLAWLTMTTGNADCITPLTGIGTNYCRYDIPNFMVCSTDADCQYPYSHCNGLLSTCEAASGSSDPIKILDFQYNPVGVNFPMLPVKGAFYAATFATTPPEVDNATGGKLLSPYTGFLTSGQFADQEVFRMSQLVTFSRYTSFCVASLAVATYPPSPPHTPYQTAIFEDPNPVLVMASIIPTFLDPTMSTMWISLYSQSYPIPGLDNPMYNPIGSVMFPSNDARIWNPWAISQVNPNLKPVPSFVSNPIITPWLGITPSDRPDSPQLSMTHTLFYAGGVYRFGFLFLSMGLNPVSALASAELVPALAADEPLTPEIFLITSWDAISTILSGTDTIRTTVIMYGISSLLGGQYTMYAAEIVFTSSGGYLHPSATFGSGEQIPIISAVLPTNVVSPATHCRLSRASQQFAEPLLIITFFSEDPRGMLLSSFVIKSVGENFVLDNSPCADSYPIPGVASILYVTPVTGAYNYGGFVVWCTTSETRSTFVLIQINGSCNVNFSGRPFRLAPLFSSIYWRRLPGEADNYFLYPVGGSSVPYFLATDIALTFDGTPSLKPY